MCWLNTPFRDAPISLHKLHYFAKNWEEDFLRIGIDGVIMVFVHFEIHQNGLKIEVLGETHCRLFLHVKVLWFENGNFCWFNKVTYIQVISPCKSRVDFNCAVSSRRSVTSFENSLFTKCLRLNFSPLYFRRACH